MGGAAAMRPEWVAIGEHGGGRVSWEVDYRRLLLTIRLRGGVTDEDLSRGIPRIWQDHPEVLDCATLVDARDLTGDGKYGWRGLRDVARSWKHFAMGRDEGSKAAIVLRDSLLTALARAIAFDYPGTAFRIFFDIDEAKDWLGVR